MSLFIEVVGWGGGALILIAYLLVSTGRLDGRSAPFQWLNIVGAAGFIANGASHGAWPSTVLNIVWISIGLMALWRLRRDVTPR